MESLVMLQAGYSILLIILFLKFQLMLVVMALINLIMSKMEMMMLFVKAGVGNLMENQLFLKITAY